VGVVSAAVSNALAAGGTGGVGMIDGAAPGISHTTAILLAIGYSLAALTTVLHVAPHRHRTRRMNRKIVIIDTLGSLLLIVVGFAWLSHDYTAGLTFIVIGFAIWPATVLRRRRTPSR
jgi:integral membrane sensor domain MASE1